MAEANTLDDTPLTKAFVEKLVEEKGRHHFEAVRLYLQNREKIGRMEDSPERTAAIEQASNTMAMLTLIAHLDATSIVADGDELARIGIAELQSIKKASFEGPSTLQ
jgi:hypothetical protein